ncbi:MAG: serine/threonine protein kinase [Kofleriaceae bacterium]|nr:serine/threonine protein kinase [Kofleriaceae bacterium]
MVGTPPELRRDAGGRDDLGGLSSAPPVETTDPIIGATLGQRYLVRAVLGHGGMGVVYRAVDQQSEAEVAIKLLRGTTAGKADADQRFRLEAAAGARLTHPNCVGVIDYGESDAGCFLVMELVEGEALGDHLGEGGHLAWRDALHVTAHLLRGLAHAHAQGVLHRDIKPDNIIITTRAGDARFARLLDFGIAKLLSGEGADVRLTATGIIIGTPRYLSPEQAVGGTIGPSTDLYSLSAVLFEMLTGRPPFLGDDLVQVVTAHAMKPPPDPRQLRPELELPEPVVALVLRGLAKRQDDRFASAEAYLEEVEQVLAGDHADGAEASAVAAISLPSAGAPGWRPSSRVWGRAAGALAGVAVAGLSLGLLLGEAPSTAGPGSPAGTGSAQVTPPASRGLPERPDPAERELHLKAGLHDLVAGKTCADRLAAVSTLRKLGDKRAVPALRKARFRMRGGLLGLGDENTNGCLRAAAEAAIVDLDPEALRPARPRR